MVRRAKIMKMLVLLILCGSAWAVEVNEPIAHWKFDEGSGTTAYDSVGDNHGTVYGAVWTTGQIGSALSFDGVNDYVDCGTGPAITGTGNFTVSAWVKVTELPASGALVVVNQRSTTSTNGSYLIYVLSSGYVHFEVFNGGYGFYFNSDVSVGDGFWHHIVEVRTSTTEGEIYIDGNLAGSGSGPAKSLNNVDVVIGRWNGGDLYFDGSIDAVRIYDKALSAEEIQQLYQDGLSSYERAIIRIEDAIAEKEEALERIDAALEREWEAYDALEELLENGDYGDLKKGDIVKAKQKIHSAIQHQEQSIDALEKSIEKLEDSLAALGEEPPADELAQD